MQAWVAPGAKLPLVFQTVHVMFSAGATTYDFTVHAEEDFYNTSLTATTSAAARRCCQWPSRRASGSSWSRSPRTCSHSRPRARAQVPSSAEAAARLGWSMTTFNRKLDNVCEKLDKLGVDGLRGGRGKLATNRRARLVEYAVATRLVSVDDLVLLDRADDSPRGER